MKIAVCVIFLVAVLLGVFAVIRFAERAERQAVMLLATAGILKTVCILMLLIFD